MSDQPEQVKKPRTKKASQEDGAPDGQMWRAVGRRKQSIARVRITHGTGKIIVNEKEYTKYFPLRDLQWTIEGPLTSVDLRSRLNVSVKVAGGGFRGQAESIRHGIARALVSYDAELKKTLRGAGFMTRDPRVKERKKPGLKRARRAPQFSKR